MEGKPDEENAVRIVALRVQYRHPEATDEETWKYLQEAFQDGKYLEKKLHQKEPFYCIDGFELHNSDAAESDYYLDFLLAFYRQMLGQGGDKYIPPVRT